MARTQVEKERLKQIRQEIRNSTIPDELKALYMMADATELMSTQTFIRIKQVFARNGYTVNENELLTGITNYCRTIKQATFQFYERIDPQIADATFFASRDENDPNFVGGANAMTISTMPPTSCAGWSCFISTARPRMTTDSAACSRPCASFRPATSSLMRTSPNTK